MPVGELLRRTSARELAEWQAYERAFGPLGPERGDYQAAVVAATIANALRSERGQTHKLADFLLQWGGRERRRQSPEEMLAVLRALAERQNRVDDR